MSVNISREINNFKEEIMKSKNIRKINDSIADKLSNVLSNMAMFYGVTFLVVAPLFFQRPTSLVAWMQYIVSVFFQGVALPLLGYTSNKNGKKLDEAIQQISDNTSKTEKISEDIDRLVKAILKDEDKEIEILEDIENLETK
jgi:hypothetical protein